ncbi:MAG: AbrB/MazE/SpoVT family DNA-binding domain-containing protein [Bacillota bacterium]
MDDSEWDIKVTSKGQITLPKQVREIMMVREGDHLQAVVKDEAIVLTRKAELSDSEQMKLAAEQVLRDLGYEKRLSDRRRLRESIDGTYPDLTRLVREGRERQ